MFEVYLYTSITKTRSFPSTVHNTILKLRKSDTNRHTNLLFLIMLVTITYQQIQFQRRRPLRRRYRY